MPRLVCELLRPSEVFILMKTPVWNQKTYAHYSVEFVFNLVKTWGAAYFLMSVWTFPPFYCIEILLWAPIHFLVEAQNFHAAPESLVRDRVRNSKRSVTVGIVWGSYYDVRKVRDELRNCTVRSNIPRCFFFLVVHIICVSNSFLNCRCSLLVFLQEFREKIQNLQINFP